MASTRDQIEAALHLIAEAPVEDLISYCPAEIHGVQEHLTQAVAKLKSIQNKPTRAVARSRITKSSSNSSIKKRGSRLGSSITQQLQNVREFLRSDVKTSLLHGAHAPRVDDPRCDDVWKKMRGTIHDELRFVLGCRSLSSDYRKLHPSASADCRHKNNRCISIRSFVNHLGLSQDNHGVITYGVRCGDKVNDLLDLPRGHGIAFLLTFVSWHTAEIETLIAFGELCRTSPEISATLSLAETFMYRCLELYPEIIRIRRLRSTPCTNERSIEFSSSQQSVALPSSIALTINSDNQGARGETQIKIGLR